MILKDSACHVVEYCMGIKSGENVLIITDKKRLRIAEALQQAAMEKDANVLMAVFPHPDQRNEKPITKLDRMLKSAIKASDVVLTPISKIGDELRPFRISIIETAKKYSRIGHMIGIEEESFTEGGLTANYKEIHELTDVVTEILSKGKHLTIISGNGQYKLEIGLGGWENIANSDCGILRKKGCFGNLPAGEAYMAPKSNYAINGEVCINLYAFPIGNVATDPLILTVEGGLVTDIKPDTGKGKDFNDHLEKAKEEAREKDIPIDNVKKIAEVGIGTNPKASIRGVAIEAEKLKGTAHIALGDNSAFGGLIKAPNHYDLIMCKPTIKVDGKTLMTNGEFENISTLYRRFEEDYQNFDVKEISNAFLVNRIKNDTVIIAGQLYKKWTDFEIHDHKTRVGSEQTAEFAARVFENIPIENQIGIVEIAKKLQESPNDVKKVLKILDDYRLVNIQPEDIFEKMNELKRIIGINFEKIGQDLTKIIAIDEQTKLILERTSNDFIKLNESINEMNTQEMLTIINNINEKMDQLDTSKVSGKIKIQSAPPFFIITTEVDAKEVPRLIKAGLNKIREHFIKK